MLLAALPVWAGPPFRTDDPQPVDYQHWELYLFSTATHVEGATAGAFPATEANYGVVPNLQLHVGASLAFYDPTGGSTQWGYGDSEFGAKFRFIQEDPSGWRPQIAIYPIAEAPTGDASRNLGTGYFHLYLPIWIQKSFGPWTTYGGGGYWINPGPGNQNYWYAGWQVQRQITDDFTFGVEVFHQTAATVGGDDSTGFNFGGIYDFNEHYHLLFSAGRGVQNSATTNQFSYYLAIQWTF